MDSSKPQSKYENKNYFTHFVLYMRQFFLLCSKAKNLLQSYGYRLQVQF